MGILANWCRNRYGPIDFGSSGETLRYFVKSPDGVGGWVRKSQSVPSFYAVCVGTKKINFGNHLISFVAWKDFLKKEAPHKVIKEVRPPQNIIEEEEK